MGGKTHTHIPVSYVSVI